MPDLKKYWQAIQTIEQGLSAVVWLMSLENRSKGQVAGSIVEVSGAVAAKLLFAKSHRLATAEEIRGHQAQEVDAKRLVSRQRLGEKGIAVIPVESRPKSA